MTERERLKNELQLQFNVGMHDAIGDFLTEYHTQLTLMELSRPEVTHEQLVEWTDECLSQLKEIWEEHILAKLQTKVTNDFRRLENLSPEEQIRELMGSLLDSLKK